MSEHDELIPAEHKVPRHVNRRLDSVIDVSPGGSEGPSYLHAYALILWKRRWTILAVALLVTVLAAIRAYRMTPIYEATARVEVEAETPQIQSINSLYGGTVGYTDDYFLQTQVNVLNSEHLAWQTVQQLGLAGRKEFGLGDGSDTGSSKGPLNAVQEGLIGSFRGHLRVELMRYSRMIQITYTSTDPQLAAQAANALVNNYIEYNFHQKYDATREASGFMEQQLDELKARVEKSQQALVDYERKNLIVNISDKQTVAEQRLEALSKDLTEAQNERIQKQSVYEMARSNPTQAQPQSISNSQNDLLTTLDEKYANLREEYVDALAQYGPNFPKVQRLRAQLDEVQSIIDREQKRHVARLRSDYMAALGREKLLTGAVTEEKAEVGKLNQLMIEHNLLKREFETNQQLYDTLLQHLKDATVSAGLRATNIHLVDAALVPTGPVAPNVRRSTEMGLLLGLALGVALAFVLEGLDTSVKTVEDVERLIPAPALAAIPLARASWLKGRAAKAQPQNGSVESIVLKQPTSSLAESYRTLRTAILLSRAPRPPQALLVTSAQPGEGKTSTSINLALGLAQRGVPVVLVDADMRRPAISRALAVPENGAGLSSLLSGAHSLEASLRQYQSLPNLWVLPAGPVPPNPADLLASSTMEEVLRELRGRFEHVVVDSAPLLLVADATILSRVVDGVVLVVESGVTATRALLRAHRVLESAGGKILGTVLNKWDAKREGVYGYHGYRGYYHAYDDGKSPGAGHAGP